MDEHLVTRAEALSAAVAADPVLIGPQAAQLADQARRAQAPEALVVALRAHAWAEHVALRNVEAKRLLDEGVRTAERHGLPRRLGELLVSRVAVQHELGRYAAAQRDVDRASVLLPAGERADLVHQQAVLLHNVGRLVEAGALYRRLVADPDAPSAIRAKAANNAAHLETELGRPVAALALIDLAGRLAEGPTLVAYVAQTRAWVTVQAGRLAEGLERFEQARELYVAAGLPLGEHWTEYSDALAGLRLLPEALDAARQAVGALPESEAPLMAAEAHLRVARLSLLTGDLPGARTAAGTSAVMLRRQRRAAWVARAGVVDVEAGGPADPLRGWARELERAGMVGDAVHARLVAGRLGVAAGSRLAIGDLRAAERLAHGAPVLVRLQGRVAAGLAAQALGSPREVVRSCRAGLADLDRHRSALPSMELRALASAHGAELGSWACGRWLPPAARRGSSPGWSAPGPPPWRRSRRCRTSGPSSRWRPCVACTPSSRRSGSRPVGSRPSRGRASPPPRPRPAAPPGQGPAHRAPVPSDRRKPCRPRPASGPRWAAASWSSTRPSTGSCWPWCSTGVAADWWSSGRQPRPVRTRTPCCSRCVGLARPGTAAATAAAAQRSAQAAVNRLRARLVEPLRLDPDAPLVVVPVGELQRLPWAPLHDGPTTVVPSARVWLRTTDAPRLRGVALIAGPDLPGAADEVIALQDVHTATSVLLPPDSTCASAVALLQTSGLAHLACHGTLRADNPGFSSLQLCDGPLTVHELALRGRAPSRIVLASCESGAQVSFPGDEALGFVSALLCRGSAGVVASGVLVPDLAAVPLMRALHGELARGATLAQGLHHARSRLPRDEPSAYAAWCAFDAYGAA